MSRTWSPSSPSTSRTRWSVPKGPVTCSVTTPFCRWATCWWSWATSHTFQSPMTGFPATAATPQSRTCHDVPDMTRLLGKVPHGGHGLDGDLREGLFHPLLVGISHGITEKRNKFLNIVIQIWRYSILIRPIVHSRYILPNRKSTMTQWSDRQKLNVICLHIELFLELTCSRFEQCSALLGSSVEPWSFCALSQAHFCSLG